MASSQTNPGGSGATQSTRHVNFAEYSTLHVYGVDPFYRLRKSYSRNDYESFRTQSAFDGYQLRQLLASSPLQSADTLRLLVNHGIVTHEHLLGIEHLISERASGRILRERRVHSATLLNKQKDLRDKNELDPVVLAEVAIASSTKSAENARVRAAIARAS